MKTPKPRNQNERHYHNYDDRSVGQYMPQLKSREQNAFDRYLLMGRFYEVQLVGFDDFGAPVYRCFASPNLSTQYNVTVARSRSGVTVTIADLEPFGGGTAAQKQVYDAAKFYEVSLVAKNQSDMDFIHDAWTYYAGHVQHAVSSVSLPMLQDRSRVS